LAARDCQSAEIDVRRTFASSLLVDTCSSAEYFDGTATESRWTKAEGWHGVLTRLAMLRCAPNALIRQDLAANRFPLGSLQCLLIDSAEWLDVDRHLADLAGKAVRFWRSIRRDGQGGAAVVQFHVVEPNRA